MASGRWASGEVSKHMRGREEKFPLWEQQTGVYMIHRKRQQPLSPSPPLPTPVYSPESPSLANLAHEDWHLKPPVKSATHDASGGAGSPAGAAASPRCPTPDAGAKPPCATSVPSPASRRGLLNVPPTCCRTGPFGTLRHSSDIHNAPLAPPTARRAFPLAPPFLPLSRRQLAREG